MVQVMVVTLVVRTVRAVLRYFIAGRLVVHWLMVFGVVLVVVVRMEMMSVEGREEVMVVDWAMVEVAVVADDGAVVVDVVVMVVMVVMVVETMMVVMAMVEVVERAVHPQEEGEGGGEEEEA